MRAEHHLNPDELLSLSVDAGSVIDVCDGVVWITADGEDVVLREGQNHRVLHRGEALVQALVSARLRLLTPVPNRSPWQRLRQLVVA